MWAFMCWLLSTIGGWGNLAKYYRSHESFNGVKSYMQSLKMGMVHYGNCITVGLNSSNMFLSVLFPFRIAHRCLIIPYSEIEGCEKNGFIFTYVNLKIKGTKIRLSKSLADKMVKASNGTWQYDRL